jgi:thiamine-monophosphate kinase
MSEFDLIARYFSRPSPDAIWGVGDDAALLRVSPGMELAVSTDMLVSGTHFFPDDDPFLIGHKTLAVNLSDMAAMGAAPRWATLSLSLPEADAHWLQDFSDGFFALADRHGVQLVGGDTTRGALNLCVTIMGEAPRGAALRRSGARVGDEIWVSGYLGDAALALAHLKGELALSDSAFAACAEKLRKPEPRVALGLALRGVASSAIDISDGLLADLGHILQCSGVGAEIAFSALPVSDALRPCLAQNHNCLLSGGDDYELCFTAPSAAHRQIQNLSARLDLPLACIGAIVAGTGCAMDGKPVNPGVSGYDHFR